MNTDALEKGFNKKLEGSLSKEECNEQVEQYTSNKDANEQKKEDASKERFHEQVNKYAAHDILVCLSINAVCLRLCLFSGLKLKVK